MTQETKIMSVPTTPSSKSSSGGFNPIDLGRKIFDVWEKDRMLGIVTAPFGIAFGIWFFTRDPLVAQIILYLSIAVGLVAIASAIKHIFVTWMQAKYGLKAREQTVIEVETDTIRDKEIAETHFQMEMSIVLARQSGYTASSLLDRSIEYMRSGKSDSDVLKIFADAITDVRVGMNKQLNGIRLPYKEYVDKLFTEEIEEKDVSIKDMPKPEEFKIEPDNITVEMIDKKADKIESMNPDIEDLKEASKKLGYDT